MHSFIATSSSCTTTVISLFKFILVYRSFTEDKSSCLSLNIFWVISFQSYLFSFGLIINVLVSLFPELTSPISKLNSYLSFLWSLLKEVNYFFNFYSLGFWILLIFSAKFLSLYWSLLISPPSLLSFYTIL